MNNNEFVIRNTVLEKYTGHSDRVSIPEEITVIGKRAFENCSFIRSIVLPHSVTKIGNGAFSGCSDLQSIYLPQSIKTFGSSE